MDRRRIIGLLIMILILTSCKNYYNNTIEWADNIKLGTTIEEVRKNQPDFVEVDWNKPDTVDNLIQFQIIKIKGNRDILRMSNYLIFVDNKYDGRYATK